MAVEAKTIQAVTGELKGVRYMREAQAARLRDHMRRQKVRDVLEVGFFQGKSSAYIAAVLEEMGAGHLTTIDREHARDKSPNIHDCLERTGLSHRVTPVFAERSYTWEMARMIEARPRPQFDLCYFDGGHTWDMTGFGLLLVDMLMRPGGWIVFDDVDWTIEGSIAQAPGRKASQFDRYSDDEKSAKPVRMVVERLAPHLGYKPVRIEDGWAFARKPRLRWMGL